MDESAARGSGIAGGAPQSRCLAVHRRRCVAALGDANRTGGIGIASLTALALMAGAAAGDGAIVAIAGIGLRRGRTATRLFATRILALLLGGLGVLMIAGALAP
jgi:hypothetical protein